MFISINVNFSLKIIPFILIIIILFIKNYIENNRIQDEKLDDWLKSLIYAIFKRFFYSFSFIFYFIFIKLNKNKNKDLKILKK